MEAQGPASAWALSAEAGDELVILGPDARSELSGGGIEWKPGRTRNVLLAGDETAAPAICAILESLDESFSGAAFIEIPGAADEIPLDTRAQVDVFWLSRDSVAHGARLDPAVRAYVETLNMWELPKFHSWLAGEASVVTGLRRHLVRDVGIDRRSVTFMGYWRRGRAEEN